MSDSKYKYFNDLAPSRLTRYVAAFFSVFLVLKVNIAFAADAGLGSAVINVVKNTNTIPGIISGICYLIGLLFGVSAIFKLKDCVERGEAQVSIWEAVKRFLAGGALFALPTIAGVLQGTLTGDGLGGFSYSGFSGNAAGGGLDSMMVALVRDLWVPMHIGFSVFSYVAGSIFMMIGILRLIKTSQDGPKGPGGMGTIMTFFTAAALFSMDSLMGAFMSSIFDDDVARTSSVLKYADIGLSKPEQEHIQAVISAVLGFVAIVGWFSFLRGWFILRGVGEGSQQASVMAAITHIVAGVLCVNLGGLLNMVQNTLGFADFGVSFT